MKLNINGKEANKVFVLEDSDERNEWFQKTFKDSDVLFITKNVETAMATLSDIEFDIVFLDHDLDDEAYQAFAEGREPKTELTGLYVAERLQNTINRNTMCIIHSMNPIGSANMVKAHPFNVMHIPFFKLVQIVETK